MRNKINNNSLESHGSTDTPVDGSIRQSSSYIRGDSNTLRCEEIGVLAEGDILWNDWESLLERVVPDHRLFGPAWYRIWNETWARGRGWTKHFCYITVRDGLGRLCGVMPVGIRRCGPFRVRTLTGYPQPSRTIVAERGREREVGRAIADHINARGWKCLQLGPLRDDHTAARSLVEAVRGRMTLYLLRKHNLAVLHSPATWDEYRGDVLGGKFFRKLGYYERRASRAGDVNIIHYRHPSEEQTPLIIRDLAMIESQSWLMRSGDPRFIGEPSQSLWIKLATDHLIPSDYFDCWIMYVDGKPVSFCLALTIGSCRHVLANNFNESYKDHRTGSTLYRHMMEEGFKRGVRTVDFGHGDLHYKAYWGAEVEGGWATYLAFPGSLAGRVVRLLFAVGHAIFGSGDVASILERLL